jgi:hypothetical protein
LVLWRKQVGKLSVQTWSCVCGRCAGEMARGWRGWSVRAQFIDRSRLWSRAHGSGTAFGGWSRAELGARSLGGAARGYIKLSSDWVVGMRVEQL